jgi:hypothetical protein
MNDLCNYVKNCYMKRETHVVEALLSCAGFGHRFNRLDFHGQFKGLDLGDRFKLSRSSLPSCLSLANCLTLTSLTLTLTWSGALS